MIILEVEDLLNGELKSVNLYTHMQLIKYLVIAIAFGGLLFYRCASQSVKTDTPHHAEGGFRNIYIVEKPRFWDFLRWRWNRTWKDIPPAESYDFPVAQNDPQFLRSNREKTTLTWIGHATLLLQLAGKNILTDPIFSERASPVQWAGPKRVVKPGLALVQLPPIDIVVISHDHYDALDENSVRRLYEREGGSRTTFFVPLGLKRWFRKRGVDRVVEMDWWERHQVGPLEIIAVPVQHWSKRGLFGRNQNLWAGWAIRSEDFSFFFAGDSGYTPHFKEIGQSLGFFDLAAIPIGAYEPRWFMKDHHMNPQEAVMVHQDVAAKKSVAIHWGTFILTDEPLDEPPKMLRKALEKQKLSPAEFKVLKHGETIIE